MAICQIPGCLEHYACRLRAKGVSVAPSATPTRISNRPYVYRPVKDPSWERGIAGETRCDGSFMPILTETQVPMGVKEYSERRHEIEGHIKRLKTDPTPAL